MIYLRDISYGVGLLHLQRSCEWGGEHEWGLDSEWELKNMRKSIKSRLATAGCVFATINSL